MQDVQKVAIKGMVCERCITSVRQALENMGLQIADVNLGQVSFSVAGDLPDISRIDQVLKPLGFSVLVDRRRKLVNDVKALVAEVYSGNFDFPERFRFSEFLASRLQKEYDSIAAIFTDEENMTIEKYIIDYRVEKVKEFLVYGSRTLSDISFSLGFSSVAHLSRQFKTVTGFNPSHFRSIRVDKERISKESRRRD